MKTTQIKERIKTIAEERYATNPEDAVRQIEQILHNNNFIEQGGEMRRISRYTRNDDEVILSFDPEHNRIGIS